MMQENHYQVVIIGAGPGGYVAAIEAAHLGLRTAIIEQAEIGGTCLNRGCIPTKTLLHTAELLDNMKRSEVFGLKVDNVSLDFDALRKRKEEVCNTLREGVTGLLEANGVDVLRGKARILSPTCVSIEQTGAVEESSSSVIVEASALIIATGTAPELPVIEGIQLPGVYTSDSILETIPSIKRLAILGGGVIGMEFAQVYASFGTEVFVLVTSDRPLRSLDRELGQSLSMEMKKQGVSVLTKATVLRIEQDGSLRLVYVQKDEEQVLDVDAVLVAKGRSSQIDDLFPQDLGISCKHDRIVVDERMRTSVEGIYAIGDVCTAGADLAHAASAEGVVAVHDIAGKACTRRLDLVPTCVYTSPEIACVGMNEAEAKAAGLQVTVGKYPMGSNAKSLITNQSRSFIKIVADEEEHVVGAQLLCARATDIVSEIALGIAAGLTVSEMLEVVRPHPTYEEAVGEALEAVTGTSIHSMPKRR